MGMGTGIGMGMGGSFRSCPGGGGVPGFLSSASPGRPGPVPCVRPFPLATRGVR